MSYISTHSSSHTFRKAAGIAAPSLTRALLEKGVNNEYEEFIIKWSAAAVYGGGADTVRSRLPILIEFLEIKKFGEPKTVAAIYSFFLSMVLNPEVQRKAQEEIDRVIGDGHLPSFSDRENLPYVNALVKETLRFFPVVPMGESEGDLQLFRVNTNDPIDFGRHSLMSLP